MFFSSSPPPDKGAVTPAHAAGSGDGTVITVGHRFRRVPRDR